MLETLNQNADKQTEIDPRRISNEPFSVVGNARVNGKCGQTRILTSSMWSAINEIYISCNFAMYYHAFGSSLFVNLKPISHYATFFARSDFFFCLTSSWLERIKIYSNFTIEYRFARQKSRRFRFFGRSTSVEIITKYFVTEIKQVQKNR